MRSRCVITQWQLLKVLLGLLETNCHLWKIQTLGLSFGHDTTQQLLASLSHIKWLLHGALFRPAHLGWHLSIDGLAQTQTQRQAFRLFAIETV
jgi:hypothetical protein